MPRARTLILAALLSVLPVASTTQAAILSKTYIFKADTTLDVGVEIDRGLRLDAIRFALPSTIDGKIVRTGGFATAHVAVSNTGEASRRVGIAVALYDDENRLLGVASGGVGLFPLKPDRQGTYSLTFENVNAEIPKATKFQISIEPKP